MELTAAGFVLVPLSLIFLFRPRALLQLTLFTSALAAAAPIVLNLGAEPFGFASGFVPGLLFTGMAALDCLFRGPGKEERQAARAVIPMLLFAGCAVAGAVVLPRLFAGQIQVWPQRVGIFNLAVPLEPNVGNITQCVYLAFNVTLLLLAALYTSRPGTRPRLFVRAYLASGYLVGALCLWQLANKLTGIYYPEDILYSNPRWTIYTEQAFGSVYRINGPFTEPAGLANYLAGVTLACLWMLLRGEGGYWVRVLLVLSFITVLLSTSTTGIIFFTTFVPFFLIRSTTTRERRNLGRGILVAIAGSLTLFVVVYLALPSVTSNLERAADIVIGATLEKPESFSAVDRSTKDLDSLGVLLPSFGLGAGWGSVRSSSLIPGLVANIGIPGLLLLGWFGSRLAALVSRARLLAPTGEDRVAMDAMAGSVIGTLCAAALSSPTIDDVDFFVRLAVMIGCAARICAAARRESAAAPTVALVQLGVNASETAS